MSHSAAARIVLVGDDTAFVRDRFCDALTGAGHKAIPIATIAELLARVRQEAAAIGLILLDLHMPPDGGVETVRAIRGVEGGRIPILVFSGTIRSADEVRDLAALGVAGYVNEYAGAQHILPALAPHLFPENFNRRGSPRVTIGIPVSYRFGNTIAAALTLNLGKGGVAIRTMSPMASGERLTLRFRIPGQRREVEAEGRVAWSDRKVGMGVQFERLDAADQGVIDDFVDQHFFSNRKG
jgi:uncharacterized protein (TIGR02266 family)